MNIKKAVTLSELAAEQNAAAAEKIATAVRDAEYESALNGAHDPPPVEPSFSEEVTLRMRAGLSYLSATNRTTERRAAGAPYVAPVSAPLPGGPR